MTYVDWLYGVMNDLLVSTQKAIVGNMSEYSVSLPELEIPDKIKCPYCCFSLVLNDFNRVLQIFQNSLYSSSD